MGNRTHKSPINVEWVNVTYRSVWLSVLVIMLGAGAGSYWFLTRHSVPRGQAQAAIEAANSRLTEAQELPALEALAEVVVNAKLQLTLARTEFGRKSYGESRIAAMRSEALSLRVIKQASGDETQELLVTFSKLEGEVRIKRAGGFSWETAHSREKLLVGDQVKTSSSGSAEMVYFDGTVTYIAPGSLVEIRDLHEDPVTKVRRVREKLTWGEVKASTQQRNVSGSFHEIATEAVSARSEGVGEFRLAFDNGTKTSVVDVFGGRIALETAGRTATVDAGQRVRADAAGQLSAKETLPGVPRLLLPSDQRVFVFEEPSREQLVLTWEELPRVERYRLIIGDKPLFTEPLYDAERNGNQAVIEGLSPGSYHWKVAGISNAGALGPFATSRGFRISSQRVRDRTDNEPPRLEITEFVPIGQMVIINGATDPDAKLWIDNNKVDVFEDGSFNAVVRLRREGVNELLIVAQDPAGNESSRTHKALVETY